MVELFLVRHGQAYFGVGNCGQLSELEYRHCQWLVEYFTKRDIQSDRNAARSVTKRVQGKRHLVPPGRGKVEQQEDSHVQRR